MITGIICGVVLILCGLLVRKYPILLAGYNTMSKKKRENVDGAGLGKFAGWWLVGMGVAGLISTAIVTVFKLQENYIDIAYVLLVFCGCCVIIIGAQRYDHNPRKIYEKILLFVIVIVLLGIGALVSLKIFSEQRIVEETPVADSRGYIVKVGDMVPSLELTLLDGTKISTDALKGRVVMLQFTASWCGVCRKEMPFIESEIWLKLKDNPDFALYGIDLKETPEQIKDFAAAIPVTYPITLDPEGKLFELFCEPKAGVTRNIILDRTGKIIMLTRLYEEEEFASMVKLLNDELY